MKNISKFCVTGFTQEITLNHTAVNHISLLGFSLAAKNPDNVKLAEDLYYWRTQQYG